MTPTQSDEELKPCPFCGEPVELVESQKEWVRCTQKDPEKCYLRLGYYPLRTFPPREHREMQIKAWNTRHAEQELEVVKRVIKDEFLKEVYADMKGCEPNRHRMYQHEVVSWLNAAIEKSKQAQGGE